MCTVLNSAIFFMLLCYLTGNQGDALQCYSCSSKESFEDCESKNIEMACPGNQQCSKQSYKMFGTKIYARSCTKPNNCNDNERYCRSVSGMSDCQIYCCKDKNLCNTVPRELASGMLILTCALVVYLA